MIPKKTPEEINELALAINRNEVFCSRQLRDPSLLSVVFMPIGLGAVADWPQEQLEDIGEIYSYIKDASPRSVNGYPSFFDVNFVNKEDWKTVVEKLMKLEEATKEALK